MHNDWRVALPRALPRLSWLDEKDDPESIVHESDSTSHHSRHFEFEGFSLAVEPPHKLFVWNFALSTSRERR